MLTVALSPDGRCSPPGAGDTVHLVDLADPARPTPIAADHESGRPHARRVVRRRHRAALDLRQPTAPRPLRTLTGPTNYVFAAAFSPDGRILAGASADKRGYLWDLGKPGDAPTAVLDGATSYAYSPAFSPDGATLAIGSADKTVQLWDVRRPDRPTPLGARSPGRPTTSTPCVQPGRTAAGGGQHGRPGVAVGQLAGGEPPVGPHEPISFDASTDPLFTVAFSPDGATLAAGGATAGCACGRSTRSAPPTPCAPAPAPR